MTIERLWVGTVPFPDLLVRLKWQGRFRQGSQHQPGSEGPVKLPRIEEARKCLKRSDEGKDKNPSWVSELEERLAITPRDGLRTTEGLKVNLMAVVWHGHVRLKGVGTRPSINRRGTADHPTSSMVVEWQYNFPIDRVDEEIWPHSRQTMPAIRGIWCS